MGTSLTKADVIAPVMIVGFFIFIALAACTKPSNDLQVSVPAGELGQNVTSAQRIIFASEFSKKFTKMDHNSTVTIKDEAGKTLVITSTMVTLAFAREMVKAEEIIKNLREMGFKRLIMTDGDAAMWNVDLKN